MARDLCRFLDQVGATYNLFYSGRKGYHIDIDIRCFAFRGSSFLMRRCQKGLLKATRSFACRLASLTGITIDTSLYRRHATLRRVGNRREDGRHKIYLGPAANLKYYNHFPQMSRTRKYIEWRPVYPEKVEPSEPLQAIWRKAVEWADSKSPVDVFRASSAPGKGAVVEYSDESIRALRNAVIARSHDYQEMGQAVAVSCPNPNHYDEDPSAIFNSSGVVHCFACNDSFSPGLVAEWVGQNLTAKVDAEVKKLGFEEKPPADVWAKMSITQRIRWYEQHKRAHIDSEPSDIDGMRRELSASIRNVLNEGKSAVVRSSVGLGKSHGTRVQIHELGLKSLWLAPTHSLLEEAGEHFDQLGGHKHLKRFDHVAPNCRNLKMPASASVMDAKDREEFLGDAEATPSRADEIQFRQSQREGTRGSVCGTCPRNPAAKTYDQNHKYGDCPFIAHVNDFFATKTKDEEASIIEMLNDDGPVQRLMPTAHIGLSGPEKVIDDVDVVVIDESALDVIKPVKAFKMKDLKILGSKKFADTVVGISDEYRPDNEEHDEADFEVTWGEVWRYIRNDETRRVKSLFYASLPEIAGFEGIQSLGGINSTDIESSLDRAIAMAAQEQGEADKTYRIGFVEKPSHNPVVAFLRTLKRGVIDVQVAKDYKGTEYLITVEQRGLDWVGDTPVIILDATAEIDDLEEYTTLFDRYFEDLRFVAENENTVIYHDPEKRWSRRRCRAFIYDEEVSGKPVDDLISYMRDLDGEIGVISWKDNPIVNDVILPLGLTSPELCLHYGALRGMDELKGVDHLVIVGGPSVNEMALKMEWCRMHKNICGIGEMYNEAIDYAHGYSTRHYRLNYPMTHGRSETGRKCFNRVITREMKQAVGRARGLTKDVEIHAFCAEDVYMPEFSYKVVPGRVRPVTDIDQMWKLALNTFLSKKAIAERTGLGYEFVKDALADMEHLDHYRVHAAMRLHEKMGNWEEVAKEMETTRNTIYRKRRKCGM